MREKWLPTAPRQTTGQMRTAKFLCALWPSPNSHFYPYPPKPSALGTKSQRVGVRFRPFELGHPFDDDYVIRICQELIQHIFAGDQCCNTTWGLRAPGCRYEVDVTYLTHCSHLGIFCGIYEKGKDYPAFHPSIHPLYPLLPALWVAGFCWTLSLAVIGRRRK